MVLWGLGIGLMVMAGAVAEEGDASRPVSVTLWAASAKTVALQEEMHFDRDLEPMREAVARLPFNSYKNVKTDFRAAPFDKETRIRITSRYTLVITPDSRESTDNRIGLHICVEMRPPPPKKGIIKALETRIKLAQKKKLALSGLKLVDKSDLVMVLMADR